MNVLTVIVLLLCVHKAYQKRYEDPDLGFSQINEITQFRTVHWLILEILGTKVSQCDLILLNDDYCKHQLVHWISRVGMPTYSLSLDVDYSHNKTLKKLVSKPSGFSQCSNIVVCCWSFKTCRNPHSSLLFNMLDDKGILKLERRSFLFIANLSTSKVYSKTWHEDENTGNPKNNKYTYSIPAMNKATFVLEGLKSHITLIQRYDTMNTSASAKNFTTLQLLTWTTNWVPGGTPVIPHVYTLDQKFWPAPHESIKITRNDIQPGGTVKFCTSSKSLLPMISVVDKDPSSVKLKGLEGELIKVFQKRFALKLEFFEPGDYRYGVSSGGDWNGVISHVIDKNADFGIGQLTFSAERFNSDLKFSPAFLMLQGAVVCTIPEYIPEWKVMVLPFQRYVWIATLCSFVLGLVSLQIIQKVTIKLHQNQSAKSFPWVYLLGPIFQRAVPMNRGSSKADSFLVGFSSWLICGFLLSICYSNILTGILTFPPRESPINSLRDLISSDRTWSVTGLVDQAIPSRKGTIEGWALEKAKSSGLISVSADDEQAYKHALEHKGCLIAENKRAQYMIATYFTALNDNHPTALLRISTNSFLLGPTGWAMRGDIDFILQSYFDILFLNFRAHGFLDKTIKEISPHLSPAAESREPSSLRLETIQVLFYFLIVAHVLNTLVFFGELAFFRLWRDRSSEYPKVIHSTYTFMR